MKVIKKKGPWKVLKSKVKYKNPWMTVTEDQVIHPNNKKGIFGTVEVNDGVSVISIDNYENAYLVREYHFALEKKSIEAVSGGMDGDEKPLQAAKRELLEEAGIKAKKWTYLGYVNPMTTFVKSKNHLFLAQDLSFFKNDPEGTETIEVVKLPFKKVLEKILNGEISHAGTVVAILKIEKLLETKTS